MITVSILINGQPIVAKNAINQGTKRNGFTEYKTDSGEIVLHKPEDGARYLAHMLLDTIRNDGSRPYKSPDTHGLEARAGGLEKGAEIARYFRDMPLRNEAYKAACREIETSCLATAIRIRLGQPENPTSDVMQAEKVSEVK